MKISYGFEKKNSATKDTPFVSVRAKILRDYPHFHEEIEFVKCDKGTIKISTNDISTHLGEGEICFFMPYEIHNVITQTDSFGTVLKMQPIAEDISYTRLLFTDKFIRKNHKYYDKINHALEKAKNPAFPQKLSCATAANELFLLIMQNIKFDVMSESEIKIKLKNIAILDKVQGHLKTNYMNKITLDETAKLCAISKYHFSHIFRSIAGICFSDYVTQYRLKKAIALMKTSDMTQLDIAYSCGFNNFQTYIRSFEKFFDTTPNKYKKIIKKD